MLAASILALAAAGCEGDDEGDPKDRGGARKTTQDGAGPRPAGTGETDTADANAIREVLVTAFKTDDPDVGCTRIFTRALLRRLYEDEAGCRRVAEEDEDEKDPDRVAVSAIDVRGRQATAKVRLIGGDSAGTEGIISLADVGRWRVDDLSLGFLRSAFTAGLATEKEVPREVARCIEVRLMRMATREFKEFAYGSIGKRPDARRRLVILLSRCERATGRTSTVRREFLKGVAMSLRRAGADRRVVTCVTQRLRRDVSEETLIELSGMKRAVQRARVRRLVLAVLSACGAPDADGRPREAA